MLEKEKLSGCWLLPRETVLPEALLGFKRLHDWQGALGESCELFCNPEALEIGQYQWLSCLVYFPASALWDTCYCLFFNVLITDVLMLFPGRLGETFILFTSFFFFSLDNDGKHRPSNKWSELDIRCSCWSTQSYCRVLIFLQFLGWTCLFVIPAYGDKAGGPTSFSGWLCFRTGGLLFEDRGSLCPQLMAITKIIIKKRAKRGKRLTPNLNSRKEGCN